MLPLRFLTVAAMLLLVEQMAFGETRDWDDCTQTRMVVVNGYT